MAKARLKSKAQTFPVPQSRDEAAAQIRLIGDLQRAHLRQQAQMNDEIAAITARFQPHLDALGKEIGDLQMGVQTYAEANRDSLTDGGKVKSANLVTGEIQWRIRPPSVRVTGAEAVIEALKRLGLGKFVRTKDEVNKEAILNEPEQVKGVAGITIVSGVEDFVITPFEQEAVAA
jgi:phage host-nuclease inhibitor protein Gam